MHENAILLYLNMININLHAFRYIDGDPTKLVVAH